MTEKSSYTQLDNSPLSMQTLIKDCNADLGYLERYKSIYEVHRQFLESLGGIYTTSLPLPEDTQLLARSYPGDNEEIFFQTIHPTIPFTTSTTGIHDVDNIVALDPSNANLWHSLAKNGKISNTRYIQKVGDEVKILDAYLMISGSLRRIMFLTPVTRHIGELSFGIIGGYYFKEVPKELDRAMRVYNNYCIQQGEELLYDETGKAAHSTYRNAVYGDNQFAKTPITRIAIEYDASRPNRMKPVIIKVM